MKSTALAPLDKASFPEAVTLSYLLICFFQANSKSKLLLTLALAVAPLTLVATAKEAAYLLA